MITGTTARGFGRLEFDDVAGTRCSLQDSSLASDDCVWLGHDHRDATRMHLTRGMARRVARAMRSAAAGEPFETATFSDRYGSACGIGPGRVPESAISIGVDRSFGGGPGGRIEIGRGMAGDLLPALASFVANGVIGGEPDLSALDEAPRPFLDVKIPPSMLDRADVGATGIPARMLVDAFLRLYDAASDGLVDLVGQDDAIDMETLAVGLAPLRGE